MKISKLSAILAGSLLLQSMTFAAVPSLINYQGRISDSVGDPVIGTKNFTVEIYDAETAGNMLYTENVGAVTLDNKGIYQFQFGATGTSNTELTEAVATTDGTASTFQKVLTNAPVVSGSLSITDGSYTWDQTNGSSNEDEFGVNYSVALNRVTVIYYSGAPVADREITATYKYTTNGIAGALASDGEQWMQVSVDGVPQNTRQRVLAVPFATYADKANTAATLKSVTFNDIPFNHFPNGDDNLTNDEHLEWTPLFGGSAYKMLPTSMIRIRKIEASVEVLNRLSSFSKISLIGVSRTGSHGVVVEKELRGPNESIGTEYRRIPGTVIIDQVLELDHLNHQYYIRWSSNTGGELLNCKISYDALPVR